ncbi:hypothetical protein [Planomonospora parontospora]|uniref:hypothetical protein n=1 Tax=Planomonospora parontospora TaxID=58119 RepID=UPI00167035BF|nr:hypothetical protein [Planomonospora parontospora]GGL32768.1 hypothetical protein GCM10014719_37460 [Planomonospora parontospora subsp. antibiotica]GII17030.1 hypothetical protein Ppa05_37560 [Planomonospora parontospora subsp. antibiotica]
MHDIDRLVAGIVPDPGPGMTRGARELFDEITAVAPAADVSGGPARLRWRPAMPARRRRWIALPVVAGLAAVATLAGWVLPGFLGAAPASAALDVMREGDHYVITVKDLYADPEKYESELRALGLNIRLSVEPASEAGVGRLLNVTEEGRLRHLRRLIAEGRLKAGQDVPSVEGEITVIDSSDSCSDQPSCSIIGLKVPVDYADSAEISLGRAARPGEEYRDWPDLGAPHQVFHCVRYANKTVAEVTATLRERGVTPTWTSYTEKGDRPSVPGDWYVYEGIMTSATTARVLAEPTPQRTPRPLEVFCPGGSPDSPTR